MILFLTPYFNAVTQDLAAARKEALETLASYHARTRSEMLNAVQAIAFGFSALETLQDARTTGMSTSMRLRYRGCANNLNRSCQQNEQTLARRLACDLPAEAAPVTEPLNDMPEAEFEAALQHAHAQIAAYRNRRPNARPALLPTRALPAAQQDENQRLWGTALQNVLADMGMPAQRSPAP